MAGKFADGRYSKPAAIRTSNKDADLLFQLLSSSAMNVCVIPSSRRQKKTCRRINNRVRPCAHRDPFNLHTAVPALWAVEVQFDSVLFPLKHPHQRPAFTRYRPACCKFKYFSHKCGYRARTRSLFLCALTNLVPEELSRTLFDTRFGRGLHRVVDFWLRCIRGAWFGCPGVLQAISHMCSLHLTNRKHLAKSRWWCNWGEPRRHKLFFFDSTIC